MKVSGESQTGQLISDKLIEAAVEIAIKRAEADPENASVYLARLKGYIDHTLGLQP